jgi:predicted nuclease of predicted toxin-antitoxin system
MTTLKLLVDECLSQRLCGIARSRGLEAMHVKYFDLLGTEDWELISTIQQENWTFVTNNARDFTKTLFKAEHSRWIDHYHAKCEPEASKAFIASSFTKTWSKP